MIPFYRNIPIISYIIQKGTCHECSVSISLRYPFIEIISGIVLVFSIKFLSYPESLIFYWMFIHLFVLSIIDQQWMEIPISIIISMFIGMALYNYIWSINFVEPLYGLIVGTGFITFVLGFNWIIFKKQTMGYGDLIIIAILGLWLGAINIFFSIFIASIIALLVFLIYSFFYGFDRSRDLPFVPYLSIAAISIYLFNFL